jgi:hypothetical protein
VLQEAFKGLADSFLFFLAYSYVRQKRLDARGSRRSLPALEEIGVGVAAGAFSKFFTAPIQQIVTRKQTAAMMKQQSAITIPPLSNTRDIAREIYREKGIQGFWSGYSATLILTLNPSITMLLHNALLRLIVPRARRDDPGARLTFLLAAISKALASTVTYPFSLAKTRAQVSSQKPSSTAGETSEKEKPRGSQQSKTVQARQRTVFSTILRIAQTEGLAGLYQGLGAEVLKGFFSHGITMLMKDRIHTVIISLYYTIQKALATSPSPSEIAKSASDSAHNAYEQGKEQASDAYAKSVEVAGNATESVRGVVADGTQQAQGLLEKGKEQASEAYTKSVEAVNHATESAKGAVADGSHYAQDLVGKGREQAADVYSKGTEAAETTSTNAHSAAQSASQQAQTFVEKGKEQASDAYSKAAEVAETASSNAQDAVQSASQQAGKVYETGKNAASQAASSAYSQGKDVLDQGEGAASNATHQAGDALEKGKAMASDASQQAGDAVLDADVRDINGPDGSIKK